MQGAEGKAAEGAAAVAGVEERCRVRGRAKRGISIVQRGLTKFVGHCSGSSATQLSKRQPQVVPKRERKKDREREGACKMNAKCAATPSAMNSTLALGQAQEQRQQRGKGGRRRGKHKQVKQVLVEAVAQPER